MIAGKPSTDSSSYASAKPRAIFLEWKALSARVQPYALACVFSAVAAAAQVVLSAWMHSSASIASTSLAVFMPAVAASAAFGLAPGILTVGLSVLWLVRAGGFPAQRGELIELALYGLSAALVVAILAAGRRSRLSGDLLFKAVQDISIEGVVVYRAVLDRGGEVMDFEYRYVNPAAYSIMKGRPEDVVGARLLERLPEARNHPQPFPRYASVFNGGQTSEAEYEIGGKWFHSTVAKLHDGLVVTVQDVSVRRRSDDIQKLLVQELNHRVKNLLASVIAMVVYTERGATTATEFRDKLAARLHALSRAHSLLSASAWTDAAVRDVVKSTLEPHLDLVSTRFQIEGGDFRISSENALALNMALHELATNAAKYGALAVPRGRIAINWTADRDRPRFIRLTWSESGGPTIMAPPNGGFGTKLLGRAFAAYDGEVKLTFAPDGVSCEMRFASADDAEYGLDRVDQSTN
jgi:two-component sensor histidine kinase